jgi:hypothetical protein
MELSLDTIKIICKFNPKSFYKVNKYFTDYYLKINKSASIIQNVYKKWHKNKFDKFSFENYERFYIPDTIGWGTTINYGEFVMNYNITIDLPPIIIANNTKNEEKRKNRNRNKNNRKNISKINKNKFNKINRINKKRINFNKKKRNFKRKL